jgi:glyoxylase I family protein
MTILGYHHVSLSVSDLGRSAEWYREVLGFDVDAEIDGAGFRRVRLRVPGSGVTLSLTAHDQHSGDTFDERRTGLDHVALDVGTAEEMQHLKRRFENLGIDHSELKQAPSGNAMITLRDPDNIQLEVFGKPSGPEG